MRMAYIALMRTHVEYCSSLLMSSSASQLKKLDIIQKKAARAIMHAPKEAHAAPLLELLSLESLSERRDRHALAIIRSVLAGSCHPALSDFFSTHPDGTMTAPPKSKLQVGGKRFRVRGVEVFKKYLN